MLRFLKISIFSCLLLSTFATADLLISDFRENTIFRLNPTTGTLDKFIEGVSPGAIDIGADSNLYVANWGSGEVFRYDGETGEQIDNAFVSNSGLWTLKFSPDGQDLFVGDWTNNSVFRHDAASGAELEKFVASGSGGLSNTNHLNFGPNGNLLVSSAGSKDILEYDANGNFVRTVVNDLIPSWPTGFAVGPDGNIYIPREGSNDDIVRFDFQSGQLTDVFVSSGAGGLNDPKGLGFGPDGNLYVTSATENRVYRYNGTSGSFIDSFQLSSGLNFDTPSFLTFSNANFSTPIPEPATWCLLLLACYGLLLQQRRRLM